MSPPARDDARAAALAEELGAQLGRMKGAGPAVKRFLSMVRLDPPPVEGSARAASADGTRRSLPFAKLRRLVEKELDARLGELFDDFEQEPFAVAALGQVHRATTSEGDDVAVKVQHPGAAEDVEADLRNLGLVGPILRRLAPELDAGSVLAEIRDRIAYELDYELEAQSLRRAARLLRGHPHVSVPKVHTDLSARRVLVTELLEGAPFEEIARLGDADRDRLGEIAFRCFLGLAWRSGVAAGDPHPRHCVLAADGRLCLLGFSLLRDLDPGRLEGERAVMRAVAASDPDSVHAGVVELGYLPDPEAAEPAAVLDLLRDAGGWMLSPGLVRIDAAGAAEILERGYPPRSANFPSMRRMGIPAATLVLRRMEVELLQLLGELRAAADWGAIAAELHSGDPPSTPLGRAETAFWERQAAGR